MICGGNLIGGWASRDLIYVSPLLKAYHTDEKSSRRCVRGAAGVNTVLTNPAADRVLNDYWNLEGGKSGISDCASATS